MHRAPHLLQMLLTLLAGKGLAPEALDPWRAWQVFKQYARIMDEVPEPGVSVQFSYHPGAQETSLVFLRQSVELQPEDQWLAPVGGVVCDLVFDGTGLLVPNRELWTFDFGTFERFVDTVERDDIFGELIVRRPIRTGVYWLDV